MSAIEDVKQVLADVLQLGDRAQRFQASTPLLGSVAELDSMAVVSVITGIEQHFGITVHDDEISASTFETVGTLAEFVERKLPS
jgi:acyl carrier protein